MTIKSTPRLPRIWRKDPCRRRRRRSAHLWRPWRETSSGWLNVRTSPWSPRDFPTGPRASDQRAERASDGGCKFGIVDVTLDADELAIAGLAHTALQRGKQRRVGLRIPERLAGGVERGDAAFRQEEAHRPIHPVELVADPAADALVLLRRGAHQGHLRIMDVE